MRNQNNNNVFSLKTWLAMLITVWPPIVFLGGSLLGWAFQMNNRITIQEQATQQITKILDEDLVSMRMDIKDMKEKIIVLEAKYGE